MTTELNPYLNFRGTARDAMTFYQSVFGGELTVSTFAELQASQDPSEDDLVMHSVLVTETGMQLMAADMPERMELRSGNDVSLSLSGDDERLRNYWAGLSEGGTVTAPLEQAAWGDAFGMCRDKYGVSWLVNISGPSATG